MSIEAWGTTSAVDPKNAPASAVPVAHLVNLDKSKTEKFYGLLPGDQAEYDLWVNRKPGSTLAEWRIVGVMKSGQLVYGEARDLTYCHLYKVAPGATDADFAEDKLKELGDCNAPKGTTDALSGRSSLSFTAIFGWIESLQSLLFPNSRTGGGWIECPNGCCT